MDDKGNYSLDGSAEYARKALQLSLKNLGVDYIDLYILRSKDPNVPIEDSIKGMAVSNMCCACKHSNCMHWPFGSDLYYTPV